ncbi:MAG: hypothetical protein QG608_2414 [Actinomycetota bacterium]|nr:hypothetical protein [Actinomycetota bacterium]
MMLLPVPFQFPASPCPLVVALVASHELTCRHLVKRVPTRRLVVAARIEFPPLRDENINT